MIAVQGAAGMTNTRNTPLEALESAYPLRVLRQRESWLSGRQSGAERLPEKTIRLKAGDVLRILTVVFGGWGLLGGHA